MSEAYLPELGMAALGMAALGAEAVGDVSGGGNPRIGGGEAWQELRRARWADSGRGYRPDQSRPTAEVFMSRVGVCWLGRASQACQS